MLLLTAALAVAPAGVRASTGSEYFSDPFLASWGPVRPIGELATGSLGVVERTWWRRPLLLAWFRFNELPFPAEAADAFSYHELGAIIDPRKSVAAWREAAKTAAPDLEPAGKPGADADLPGTTWGWFENCPADSWEQARRTLLARSEVWGAGSTALRNWIVAQHQVFARCRLGPEYFRKDVPTEGRVRWGRTPPEMPLPDLSLPEPPPGAPRLLLKDRDYQRASALFYEGHYADAERAFRAIARDARSPWRGWGQYLALRAHFRQLEVIPGAMIAENRVSQLRRDVDAALADARRRGAGEEVARLQALRSLVGVRLEPATRFRELGAALSRPQTDATTFRQAVIDYAYLHRQLPPAEPLGEWLTGLIEARDPTSRSCGGRSVSSDISDPTPAEIRCRRAQLSQKAFTRYQKSPGKRAWLFTAAAFAELGDPHREALLQALVDVPDGHPGSTTFLLHRLRLSGRNDGRHLAEVLLARPEVVADYSARNRVRQYRMLSAASLEEFWSDAVRERGGGIDRDTLLKGPPVVAETSRVWDADGTWILDYELPDSALLATATQAAWPETLRRQVAGMLWARAVLRGDTQSARNILGLPELQGTLSSEDAARLASIGDDAVFLMEGRLTLWNRALAPVVGGDWCRLRPPAVVERQEEGWGDRDDPAYRFGEAAMRLLPGDALERWRAERHVLDALPPRPNLLMQNTLDFVARFPSDPRAPRLLRQTVHATRLDHCGDAAAGALSKKAFNLLQRHYRQTEEARRTRHWFKPGY
ncbi:hypothetical protein [Accumulibacter sp.]|uniref:hypothetical protein n=1 Tax=Accumulibacter sp. TaxID=2053492 RepID=UPI0035B488EF